MMFGNDKKLLLPIVFDIANLIKSSTRKYINLGSDLASAALFDTRISRRGDARRSKSGSPVASNLGRICPGYSLRNGVYSRQKGNT